jgi:alpha-L-fucosidase 2
VSESGAETAQVMYGKEGWVAHHNTDIWRVTGGIDRATSGMWMTCGAWLSAHLWQHYLYTGDRRFLEQAYPIMKGAARFLDAMLIAEPTHGWLVISPTVSPENSHPSPDGSIAITYGATMDNQLIYELFHSVIAASKVLGVDKELDDYYTARLGKMAPLQIGRWGQLQDGSKTGRPRRHAPPCESSLWGFPGAQDIALSHTAALRCRPHDVAQSIVATRRRDGRWDGRFVSGPVSSMATMPTSSSTTQLTLTEDRFIAYGTNKKKGGTYRNPLRCPSSFPD